MGKEWPTFHPITLPVAKAHLPVAWVSSSFPLCLSSLWPPDGACGGLPQHVTSWKGACLLPQGLTYSVQGRTGLPARSLAHKADDSHFSKQTPAQVRNVCTACQKQPAARPNADVPRTIDVFLPREEKLQKKKKVHKTETVFSPDNLKRYYLTKGKN